MSLREHTPLLLLGIQAFLFCNWCLASPVTHCLSSLDDNTKTKKRQVTSATACSPDSHSCLMQDLAASSETSDACCKVFCTAKRALQPQGNLPEVAIKGPVMLVSFLRSTLVVSPGSSQQSVLCWGSSYSKV